MHGHIARTPAEGIDARYCVERGPRRWVAYLGDPSAVATTGVLLDQKRTIDAYADARRMRIECYLIDSGMVPEGELIAPNLLNLFETARLGEVDGIVVEHVSRFSANYTLALRIAVAFSVQGVVVHEARGGVVTVEHGVAAILAPGASEILAETFPATQACPKKSPCFSKSGLDR